MKNIKLNQEEEEIIKDFEIGKFKRVKNIRKEKERHKKNAKFTLSKPRSINIRLSEKDLNKIKALAAEKGCPTKHLLALFCTDIPIKRQGETLISA